MATRQFKLFLEGGHHFCGMSFFNFKMSYLRSYLRYWKKNFSFQLPLNSSFKNGIKKERFKSIKIYLWKTSTNNVIIWHFGAILYASLIGHPLSPTTTPTASLQIFTFHAFNQFSLHGRRLSIPIFPVFTVAMHCLFYWSIRACRRHAEHPP